MSNTGPTGSDNFIASYVSQSRLVRAGCGFIAFHIDGTTYSLPIFDISFQFGQQSGSTPLPASKQLYFTDQGQGVLQFTAIPGADLTQLISWFGDLCNINDDDNLIAVQMMKDVKATTASGTTDDILDAVTFNCYNCLLDTTASNTKIQGKETGMILIALKLKVLYLKTGHPSSVTGIGGV